MDKYQRNPCILTTLAFSVLMALCVGQKAYAAQDIEFNTDVLDLNDRSKIDLSQFSQAGYIMPGTYTLAIQINSSSLPERPLTFLAPDNNPKGSKACLTNDVVQQLGLTESARRKLTFWHRGECLNPDSLPGMSLIADLSSGALRVNLPQSYLEYSAENWDPPSRWDEGIAGALLDYSLNSQFSRQSQGEGTQSLSGDGVAGVNLGPWRLRADWQANYDRRGGRSGGVQKSLNWSRYYLYRAIPALRSKLSAGENYLDSGMFDSFRYMGASLVSDDGMLPPNLRGYAPEVSGVAKTNAKVTISQQGRILYETTVAAGPFRIRDLSEAVSGKLDVSVNEQDGSIQIFQVDTATIPYLTRPGLLRYKVSAGQPSDYEHHTQGPGFGSGEFSLGVNNGWSVYGGGLLAGDYSALALGMGRDLLAFGAISFDITQSRAKLPREGRKQGGSYRVSYSKRFDETGSQVTFAGYRFSERDFMSMSQYLDARYHKNRYIGGGKEMYTISVSQQLEALHASLYVNYNHQTYWNSPASNTWSLSFSNYFDAWKFKNLSLSVSANRTLNNGKKDDGIYLGLSVPWGDSGSISYSGSYSGSSRSHSLGYSDRLDNGDSYSLSTDGQTSGSGYYTHQGQSTEMNLSGSLEGSRYSAMGLSLRGGMTATKHGAALHRINSQGGTRMMVDTAGVSGVPVESFGSPTYSNIFGKAVVGDVANYYRSSVNVDLDKLGNDVEATRSVVQGTLTEGAIGYRRFGIIAGKKAMAVIRLADGSVPPFAATVLNEKDEQTGILSEDGSVWLSGMNPGEKMTVNWDGDTRCVITLPQTLPPPADNLLLPCVGSVRAAVADKAATPSSTRDGT